MIEELKANHSEPKYYVVVTIYNSHVTGALLKYNIVHDHRNFIQQEYNAKT